jgi:hypothetical protein
MPNGLEHPALGRQARVRARRGRHGFYSMTYEKAGKRAFSLRKKARRSKIMVVS